MTAQRRVYDSRHLQADCQEPGSAPEPCSVIGNIHKKFGEYRMCSSKDMIMDKHTNTDRQTDRHAHYNTPLPYRGRSSSKHTQTMGCAINQSIYLSINQSIDQSINQSINRSIDGSINHSIKIRLLWHDKMQANNLKQKGNTLSKRNKQLWTIREAYGSDLWCK